MSEERDKVEAKEICRSEREKEDEINLFELWQVIWKRRRFVAWIVGVIVLLTVIVSLVMTNIYEAKAVITPVESKNTGGGGGMAAALMQQMGGLAGIGLPDSASAAEIMLLLKSNVLREKIIRDYTLLPVLFSDQWDEEKKAWKKGTGWGFSLNPLTLISKLFALVKPADKKAVKKDPGIPDVWDGLRALNGLVKISNNIKDKSITITAEFDDPVIAANIANYFLAALNNHMSSEAKRVAAINKKYLEEQLQETADPLIKQKIYNMIAQQIETAMMAEVKENFSFKIIDPPKVPDQRIKPKRTQMVILSFIVSLFIAVFIVFFLEYLEKVKRLKTKG
ncbi:MAG: cryptic autophosphorylating protein tyrosine kinase Etk [Smithella sp. PtaU1.Bin162]|nr:MAG: cryptic autophosphorylating protein tyrosine kinase Etk [Smithella sp. PtaU1.Bin162]